MQHPHEHDPDELLSRDDLFLHLNVTHGIDLRPEDRPSWPGMLHQHIEDHDRAAGEER